MSNGIHKLIHKSVNQYIIVIIIINRYYLFIIIF